MQTRTFLATALIFSATLMASVDGANAEQVRFGDWKHQKFSLLGGNDWSQKGNALDVVADGSVSLVWSSVPAQLMSASSATWTWEVRESVPPTDLTQKGGDDRNLSLYAIFLPSELAASATDQGVRALLENPDVRVLMYVWGGNHARGSVLASPYLGERGKTIAMRSAGTGKHSEAVNLVDDVRRAFNKENYALVGLAVSADADDTETRLSARIENLHLN
jgi:hypothetical protein